MDEDKFQSCKRTCSSLLQCIKYRSDKKTQNCMTIKYGAIKTQDR